MFIKYSDKDCRFLENNAVRVTDGVDVWYLFPYYLRRVGDGIFEEVGIDKLPIHIKELIISEREKEVCSNQENID